MVYDYVCEYCGMTHQVVMTAEQFEAIQKKPRDVYHLLPNLLGCYKRMIVYKTCPHCDEDYVELKQQ